MAEAKTKKFIEQTTGEKMKSTIKMPISAVIFPFIFSACVSQPSMQSFDQQAAAKARVELALGYLQQNNPQQAKINLDKALQHDKNYYLVHSVLAHYYQLQGDVDNAQREYEIALKLDDKQGDVYNNFGTFLCGQNRFEQAQAQFEQALNAPNYYRQADTLENMVLCAYSAKKREIYQQTLQKLRQIDRKRAEKLNTLK